MPPTTVAIPAHERDELLRLNLDRERTVARWQYLGQEKLGFSLTTVVLSVTLLA
jgi:hypothetical protein